MHIDKFRNESGGYESPEGVFYEDAIAYIQNEVLGHCGCGIPEDSLRYIRDVLRALNVPLGQAVDYKAMAKFFGGNAGLEYTIYYMLTKLDLLEHGGSVPGWLTRKGVELLEDLEELNLGE